MVTKDVEKADVVNDFFASVCKRKISYFPGTLGWKTDTGQNEPLIIKEGMVSSRVWGQMGSTHRASPV